MATKLTSIASDPGGAQVLSQIYPEPDFTDGVAEIKVAVVDLETFYLRNKADLVISVKSRNSISFAEAEDVVQDAFARALQQLQTKPISNPAAWFKEVTRRIVADRHPKPTAHRKRRVQEALTDPVELPERRWDRVEGTLPPAWLEMKEEARLAAEEISALTGKPRAVMAEHYEGASNEEIAQRLGMSPAAVRQNLARGRKALRKRVEAREKGTS